MGNAPQSRPPRPNDRRVVIPITTTARPVGTRLRMLPPLSHGPPCTHLEDDNVNHHYDHHDPDWEFPPQLEDTAITRQEYTAKMEHLEQQLLATWLGGWALIGLFGLSVAILVAFVAAYCTPAFWSSPLFDHPFYALLAGAAFLTIYLTVIRCASTETQRVMLDVEDLFRPWRAYGVLVVMKRVANIEPRKEGTGGTSSSSRGYSGIHCFCLVMSIAESGNGQEDGGSGDGGDTVSVGTVNTEDDKEGV